MSGSAASEVHMVRSVPAIERCLVHVDLLCEREGGGRRCGTLLFCETQSSSSPQTALVHQTEIST